MFRDLFQLYQIGRELGLNKKEINSIFLFDKTKHSILYTALLIVSIVAFGILIVILGIQVAKNIYPSGTLYNTVNKKDFKRRKRF